MPKNHKWPNDVAISVAPVQVKDVKRSERNQGKNGKWKMENESTFNS